MYFLILLTIGNPQWRMKWFQLHLLISSIVIHVIELSPFGQALIRHLDKLFNPDLDFIFEHARSETETRHFQCSLRILRGTNIAISHIPNAFNPQSAVPETNR